MVKFLKSAYQEFQKVEWPSKEETRRLTTYVIGVSLLVGAYVAGVDYLFKEILATVLQ